MKVGETVCKMQNNVFPTVFICGIGCSDTLPAVCRQFKSTSAIALPNRLPE